MAKVLFDQLHVSIKTPRHLTKEQRRQLDNWIQEWSIDLKHQMQTDAEESIDVKVKIEVSQ